MALRDLNLGPDSKKLIERYNKLDRDQRSSAFKSDELAMLGSQMAKMLERWLAVAWCWVDNNPAQICQGPHFRVKYRQDAAGKAKVDAEVIEPYNHIGETFQDVPYTVIKP